MAAGKVLKGKVIRSIVVCAEGLQIHKVVVLQLVVHVVAYLNLHTGDVLLLEIHLTAHLMRNHPHAKAHGQEHDEHGRYKVRHHEPVE